MPVLYHQPLCPHSRFVRILLAEYGIEPKLIEEKTFERREAFLILNPAGRTPVFVEDNGIVVPGADTIAEYADEVYGHMLGSHRLLPDDVLERVEVRRLLAWFQQKFFAEVSDWLITEKVYKRFRPGGGAPDMDLVRAARTNIRYHLHYIGYLIGHRKWLAGNRLTYADLAAAAHLSSVDFLGDVPWEENETAKTWYARVKSRPAFRAILADRLPGLTPAPVYADLDF
jgi:glutathione S-transferase